MTAEKARLFGDQDSYGQILAERELRAVKLLGRRVSGFDSAMWERHRWNIVLEGNRHKFNQNPSLAQYLKSTVPQVLVEASPEDAIWGIGLTADSSAAAIPEQWPGLNLLGFILMEVRAELLRAQR